MEAREDGFHCGFVALADDKDLVMTDRLDEIRKRTEAATKGPWYIEHDTPTPGYTDWIKVAHPEGDLYPDVILGNVIVGGDAGVDRSANAQFLCSAREDVPFLLNEIQRLEERVSELESDKAIARTYHRGWQDAMEQSHPPASARDVLKEEQ